MRKKAIAILGLAVPAALLSPSVPAATAGGSPLPEPNSLHFTRVGKGFQYAKENGGFEQLSGIPFEQLECVRCHPKAGKYADGSAHPQPYTPACADCHNLAAGSKVQSPEVCLGCHTRQSDEVAHFAALPEPRDPAWQDLHVRKGMTCTACHTGARLHQPAGSVTSMLDPGGVDARCEACHAPEQLAGTHHTVHGQRLACAACHIRSVLSCTNCHFETEVAVKGSFKRPIAKHRGFVMLVNRKGYGPGGTDQVHPATFQSVSYKGKTFYAIAPFFSHTTMEEGRPCEDCHGGPRVQELDKTGTIRVTYWNAQTRKLDAAQGVIPVPENWSRSLSFDFADFTGDLSKPGQPEKWVFLKNGADLSQLMERYAAPLTADQMKQLATPVSRAQVP